MAIYPHAASPEERAGPFEARVNTHHNNLDEYVGRGSDLGTNFFSYQNRDDHPVQASSFSTRQDIATLSQATMLSRPKNLGPPPQPPPPPPPPLPPPPTLRPPSHRLDIHRVSFQSPAKAPSNIYSGSVTTLADAESTGSSGHAGYDNSTRNPFVTVPRSLLGHQETSGGARILAEEASSDSSDDIFETHNQQFPPLLPTVSRRTALLSQRKTITNAIARKVVETETKLSNGGGQLRVPHPGVHYVGSYPGSSAVSSSYPDDDEEENEEIQLLWTELKAKRKTIAQARVAMAQHRRRMQMLRYKKLQAEVAFMDLARRKLQDPRESGTTPADDQLLEQRYSEMEQLSTEYRHLEFDYEDLENHLDDEEGIANNFEVEFFSKIARQQLRVSSPSPTSEDEGLPKQSEYLKDTPYLLLGISRNGPTEEDHPFWIDLISSIEDMNLALEDLSELQMRHEALEYTAQMNTALEDSSEALEYAAQMQPMIGKPMTTEDADFMSKFPLLEASSKSKFEEAMQEVRRLHEKCKLYGVDKKFPSHALAYVLDPNIGPDLSLDDQWPANHSLTHAKFPTLLSAPDHVLRTQTALQDLKLTTTWPLSHPDKTKRHVAAMKEYGIHQLIYDVGAQNDGTPQLAQDPDFIPRWLLHQLRTSPLEAHRLAAIFPQVTGLAIRNYDRWQADVLKYWWRDGTLPIPRRSRKHAVLSSNGSVVTEHHERRRSSRPRTWDGVSSQRDARLRGSPDTTSLPPETPPTWIESPSDSHFSA